MLVPVTGQCFVEVCAGEAVATLGMMFANVPCIKPWDALYGERFNLLGPDGQVLMDCATEGVLSNSHSGTPCQTMTPGRWPPLRSLEILDGLPNLAPEKADMVRVANELVWWTVQFCMRLWAAGALVHGRTLG